jgi:hypothetical protein
MHSHRGPFSQERIGSFQLGVTPFVYNKLVGLKETLFSNCELIK